MLLFYYDRNILDIQILKEYTITYSKILSKGIYSEIKLIYSFIIKLLKKKKYIDLVNILMVTM